MPLANVAVKVNHSRRSKVLEFKATPSGSYVPGGDAINLVTMTNPKFLQGGLPSGNDTTKMDIEVKNTPAGYTAEVVQTAGTLATAFKLKVFSVAGTELTAAAYPAALLADFFILSLSMPAW